MKAEPVGVNMVKYFFLHKYTGDADHNSDKANEIATPFEYGVDLTRYGIRAEVSPAVHSAIYRCTYPKTDQANIVFDASHNIIDIATVMKGKGKFLDGKVEFTNAAKTELKGYGNYIGGFSDGAYKVFFCIRVSKAPKSSGTWINEKINSNQSSQESAKEEDRIGSYLQFNTTEKEKIYLKVAVSFKSVERATKWLDEEIPLW